MRKENLKKYLNQTLRETDPPRRMEETVTLCRAMVREYPAAGREERTGFFGFLSDVLRHDGGAVLGLQALALLTACMGVGGISDMAVEISVFVPLFSLAAMPVLFGGQLHRMSELEAVTRASGAQLILARLLLSGAANLVCLTVLLCLEVRRQNTAREIGQLILYALVPWLSCMTFMLRGIRLERKENVFACVAFGLLSCAFWGLSARVAPWLYELSAVGVWVLSFLIFGGFFVKEILYIQEMRKEGKMYGTVA